MQKVMIHLRVGSIHIQRDIIQLLLLIIHTQKDRTQLLLMFHLTQREQILRHLVLVHMPKETVQSPQETTLTRRDIIQELAVMNTVQVVRHQEHILQIVLVSMHTQKVMQPSQKEMTLTRKESRHLQTDMLHTQREMPL